MAHAGASHAALRPGRWCGHYTSRMFSNRRRKCCSLSRNWAWISLWCVVSVAANQHRGQAVHLRRHAGEQRHAQLTLCRCGMRISVDLLGMPLSGALATSGSPAGALAGPRVHELGGRVAHHLLRGVGTERLWHARFDAAGSRHRAPPSRRLAACATAGWVMSMAQPVVELVRKIIWCHCSAPFRDGVQGAVCTNP